MNDNDSFRSLSDKIDNLLLESRRLLFFDGVDNETARDVIRKLWYLELSHPGKPILFILNCPGGSVDAGFAIWDQVKLLTSPITTLITGMAASMGSVLSLCAPKGRRLATPRARLMIHQPSIHGMIRAQASDLSIQAEEIEKTKSSLVDLYVQETGQAREFIEKKIDRDTWMTAQEAVKHGFIDQIIASPKELLA